MFRAVSQSRSVSCRGTNVAVSSTVDLPASAMSLFGWVEVGRLLNHRSQMVKFSASQDDMGTRLPSRNPSGARSATIEPP